MAAKRKAKKKAAAQTAAADPKASIKPTPAALKDTVAEVAKVLDKLPRPEAPQQGDLVYALLHFCFSDGLADGYGQEAVRRIEEAFVDRNEFRVTEAFQVAELLGDLDIPDLFERCMAARDAIAQIYNDQNAVSLDFLREASVTDRNHFFNRVPALTSEAVRFLVNMVSFEECIFSVKSTVRVQMRLGLDPKSAAVGKFFSELKALLEPWGYLPLLVRPDSEGGNVPLDPELSPAGLVMRLATPAKKK